MAARSAPAAGQAARPVKPAARRAGRAARAARPARRPEQGAAAQERPGRGRGRGAALHNTSAAERGRSLGNYVRENGDDQVAVVSYGSSAIVRDVLNQGNDVAGQYWGRGITVVGGEDVTIRDNRVGYTAIGAGILLNRETSYKTWGVHNVLVTDNLVEHIQTVPPVYDPLGKGDKKTGQAGIDLDGQGWSDFATWEAGAGHAVERIAVRNNTVRDTNKNGIWVHGRSCDVVVEGNTLEAIKGAGLSVTPVEPTRCQSFCQGNTDDGEAVSTDACTAAKPATVTGSGLTCP